MFYKIATFTLFLIVCNAQQRYSALTCLKSDDVKGFIGEKGSKGEAGIPDNSLIKELKDKINSIQQQVQQDKENMMKEMQQGYRSLGNGWVTIFNGYQYKRTPSAQSWDASRRICRSWGGDLAVYGVQDMISRRILYQALHLGKVNTWIGLNDIKKEGEWVWVNGESGLNSGAFWQRNEPNDYGGNEDCGSILNERNYGREANDFSCSVDIIGLCEKKVV